MVLAELWLEILVVVLLAGRVVAGRWLRQRSGRDLVARDRRPGEYVALLAAGAVGVALLRAGADVAAAVWLVTVVVVDAAWEYARRETPESRAAA